MSDDTRRKQAEPKKKPVRFYVGKEEFVGAPGSGRNLIEVQLRLLRWPAGGEKKGKGK